ncbi:MAG: helix-turn-helix transcriptional regulator [Atopobiaceae bacterium]|nr:helix-turn-helix transcriptional regulator [Atopobiaceae bacterium]
MEQIDIRVRMGLRIKELRADANLSQDKLAYAIDISRSYLAEVETGKRNVSIVNIERICNGLGVSMDEFFSGELFDH